MQSLLIVLGILASLVVVHEFGHLVVAKLFNIRVDEFGIGYPPRAFTFGTWRETEYTLNWLPFGGFVRLWGEDDHPRTSGGFSNAQWWQQVLVLLAGVLMNALIAWLLFATALHVGVLRAATESDVARTPQLVHLYITEVYPDSPAFGAGLQKGDEIVSIEDKKGDGLLEITPAALSSFVEHRAGKTLTLTYVRKGATTTIDIIPANGIIPTAQAKAALGIGMWLVTSAQLPWIDALGEGWASMIRATADVAQSLKTLFVQAVHGNFNIKELVGPVGLVGVVHDASQNGLGTVFALAAFISINLALINSMPLPALDGGRIVVVLIETLIRRRIPQWLVMMLNIVGIGLILGLMVLVTYNDIRNLFA